MTRSDSDTLEIVPAEAATFEEIWPLFRAVVAEGDSYSYPPDWGIEEARAAWHAPGNRVFVARRGGRLVGTYFLRPNNPGNGAHIANAAFMVAREARRGGVGYALGRHALTEARAAGYVGMQFNMVVATNAGAIRLWRRLGFREVGRAPRAFRTPDGVLVDALIMYRDLDDAEGR